MANNPKGHVPPINESLIIDTVRIEAERQRREQQRQSDEQRQAQRTHDNRMLLITIGLFFATLIAGLSGAVQYVDIFQQPVTVNTVPRYSNFCAQFLMGASGGGMFVPAKCKIQIR